MLGSVQASPDNQQTGAMDSSLRCPTAGQRYAAEALRAAANERQPLSLVFGDSGSGKTALINSVFDSADFTDFAVLSFSATSGEFTSLPDFDNFLEAMCRRLGAARLAKQRPETLAVLSKSVGELAENGQTLLLAIDHADHLTDDVIAELVQLPEYLDVSPNRLLRVFVGSMTLASRIDSLLRRLGVDQRLSEIRLSQPTADEVAALLAYEDSAQLGGPMLTSGAIDRISAYAKSNLHWAVPMADAARVLAESEGMREVTAELVRSALLEIWSPEQELPDADPTSSGPDVLAASDTGAMGNEVHEGLSDSVSRAPDYDASADAGTSEDQGPGDPLTANAAIAAPPVTRRRLIGRMTPIAAVLMFCIGTIALALNDRTMDAEPGLTEPAVEEALDTQPPPLSTAGPNPEIPVESEEAVGVQDPAIQGQSIETTGLASEAEQYGPWPDSSSGPPNGDPSSATDETDVVPAAQAPTEEKPRKSKGGSKRTNAALRPPEKRPDDLTSDHWIQKR